MNTKLFNEELTKGYSSPDVNAVEFNIEGILCGSFDGAKIPEYGDEDIWADN